MTNHNDTPYVTVGQTDAPVREPMEGLPAKPYACLVAEELRYLADQIEHGNLLGLTFDWDGGESHVSSLKLSKPLEYIKLAAEVPNA